MFKKSGASKKSAVLDGAHSNRPRAAFRPSVLLPLAIEQRMLFDGAAPTSMEVALEDHSQVGAPLPDSTLMSHEQIIMNIGNKPVELEPIGLPAANAKPIELVVIDPNVRDWQALAAGLSSVAQLLVLDNQSDALTQIAHAMREGGQ